MEKADIVIRGCRILPMGKQASIENGALAIRGNKIAFAGKNGATTRIEAETEIDGRGKLALPGLINCHTHAAMTLFRGMAEDRPLDDWLKKTIWPLESRLKAEDVYAGSLLACLEMIKNGTTCFADMYFQEHMVAKAVEKSGLRAVLAEGIIEAGHKLVGKKMLTRSEDFAKRFNGRAEARIGTMLAPHAVYSCGPDLLSKVHEKASKLGVGVHLHLAESKPTDEEFQREHGLTETELLDKTGLLENHVLAAHCINLSDSDKRILSRRGVNVAYVPVSNMKLGIGAARIKDLTDLGINVGLGTDGPASNNALDMFETMKTGALLQKLVYLDPSVLPAHEVLRMATTNGATALGLMKEIGSLEEGKKADVVLVDLKKPHLTPLHDACAAMVYSARGSDVDTVIVDGKILMCNRQVRTLNEEAVMERAEKAAINLLA